MQYTENYQYRKPVIGVDIADIKDMNFNSDRTDALIHNTQISLAPAYDLNETYNTGDIVMYETLMYKCKEDNVTGVWVPEKWERTTAGEEGAGGGGTSVVPNPQGEPTDTLNTIGIDGTIFDIAGSGGGSGGISDEVIFTDTAGTTGSRNITLTKSLNNFDAIYFEWFGTSEEQYTASHVSSVYPIEANDNGTVSVVCYPTYGNRYIVLKGDPTSTSISLDSGTWDTVPLSVYKIHGVKFSGGGTGGGLERTLLYTTGSYTTACPYQQDVPLLDNLSKYDFISVETGTIMDNSSGGAKIDVAWYDVSEILQPNVLAHWAGYFTRWWQAVFTDTTFNMTARGAESGSYNHEIFRVFGYKIGGGSSGGGTSEYIPYSNKNNIVCEATLDNFDASSLEWGDGESPIILSQTVSMYNDEAVSIPVNTSGVIAYSDIGGNKQPFTAYMVCKAQTSGNYTRLLSALESHATNMGAMIFGTNNINMGSWNGATPTGLSATSDYIVCAIQYTGYGLGYCKVNNIDLSPFPLIGSNRYITIGRTDTGNGGDQEPCDILVKYFGVVEGTDTRKAINENVAYLMGKFGIN